MCVANPTATPFVHVVATGRGRILPSRAPRRAGSVGSLDFCCLSSVFARRFSIWTPFSSRQSRNESAVCIRIVCDSAESQQRERGSIIDAERSWPTDTGWFTKIGIFKYRGLEATRTFLISESFSEVFSSLKCEVLIILMNVVVRKKDLKQSESSDLMNCSNEGKETWSRNYCGNMT